MMNEDSNQEIDQSIESRDLETEKRKPLFINLNREQKIRSLVCVFLLQIISFFLAFIPYLIPFILSMLVFFLLFFVGACISLWLGFEYYGSEHEDLSRRVVKKSVRMMLALVLFILVELFIYGIAMLILPFVIGA